jgi:hypothetical protein
MVEGESEVMVPAVNSPLCPPVGPKFPHADRNHKEAINANTRSGLCNRFFIYAPDFPPKPKPRALQVIRGHFSPIITKGKVSTDASINTSFEGEIM